MSIRKVNEPPLVSATIGQFQKNQAATMMTDAAIASLDISAFVSKLSAYILSYPNERNFTLFAKFKAQFETLFELGEFEKAIEVVEKIASQDPPHTLLLDCIILIFNTIWPQLLDSHPDDLENKWMPRLLASTPLAKTESQYETIGRPIKELRIRFYSDCLMSSQDIETVYNVLSQIEHLMKLYEEADFFKKYEEESCYYSWCFSFLFNPSYYNFGMSDEETLWGLYEKLPTDNARLNFLSALRDSYLDQSEESLDDSGDCIDKMF